MQGDGNFVIYGRDNNGFETATWHTHTSGSPGAFFALQQDGNLVVYHPSNKPLYYTGTSSTPYADYKLSLGDDGVLRLVRKSDHKQIWTSG